MQNIIVNCQSTISNFYCIYWNYFKVKKNQRKWNYFI